MSNKIHFYVKKDNYRKLRSLLKSNTSIDINEKDENGNTPLHIALKKGNTTCISILLNAGADKEKKDSNGDTALIIAAKKNSKECVQLLLKLGGYINIEDNITKINSNLECIYIIWYSTWVDIKTIEQKKYSLLDFQKKINPDKTIQEDNTLGHFAITNGHIDLFKILLDSNENTYGDKFYNKNINLIHKACMCRNINALRLLYEKGCSLTIVSKVNKMNALHFACASPLNNVELINYILTKEHSLLDSLDNFGKSPLCYAVEKNIANVKKLVEEGGCFLQKTVTLYDNMKCSALDMAVISAFNTENYVIIDYLLSKGATINNISGINKKFKYNIRNYFLMKKLYRLLFLSVSIFVFYAVGISAFISLLAFVFVVNKATSYMFGKSPWKVCKRFFTKNSLKIRGKLWKGENSNSIKKSVGLRSLCSLIFRRRDISKLSVNGRGNIFPA